MSQTLVCYSTNGTSSRCLFLPCYVMLSFRLRYWQEITSTFAQTVEASRTLLGELSLRSYLQCWTCSYWDLSLIGKYETSCSTQLNTAVVCMYYTCICLFWTGKQDTRRSWILACSFQMCWTLMIWWARMIVKLCLSQVSKKTYNYT